jgi:proteasome alpha subunit
MAFQPYVAPEQFMKDRLEYARKGIARGKSVVALEYLGGILFLAENPSATLHKISEIYDRIAFAGVGKYSEFEEMRIAGVRLADLRGYSYGREDVNVRTLANAYSQALSAIFTQQMMKPYEVEILVGQVDDTASGSANELYHVLFDGSVTDEHGFVGIGGRAEELTQELKDKYEEGADLAASVKLAVAALSTVEGREISPDQIEAAVLDRERKARRKFRRMPDAEVGELLGS